ncbi:GNAT family N-acetyltransferase [Pseudomonas sp. LP_7_YM]|uniref:GNAT family N-acetyltransferase n=1 Tax=Pseudomonas sp. LP_7_YM TaxID=2485137 RepID=UPI00105DD723|nr:GNAT family N-acetyltransferase [Pseudomonas sp. LP_7_YM]TDV72297.1 putative N-acetyltransferase YhbS [Pseudomonas sp. LP_7_YM]
MKPTTTLRRAQPDDVKSVAALVDQAYAPYVARIGQKPGPMLEDYSQVIAESVVFVHTHDTEITGVLVMSLQDSEMLLLNVAVAPLYKGRGLGKQLMAFCEDYARSQGCDGIRLYTHELMSENLAIYCKLGYQETHRAVEDGFARVFMRKSLQMC